MCRRSPPSRSLSAVSLNLLATTVIILYSTGISTPEFLTRISDEGGIHKWFFKLVNYTIITITILVDTATCEKIFREG